MKKNISINISGIIFHVEEDGYERLKNYLESINHYFSTFEDSKEIIADIENRIAEIFFTKLTHGKQVINMDDIEGLIATMGTIADFEAIEDEADHKAEPQPEASSSQSSSSTTDQPKAEGPKRLFKDSKRRVIGGVAAGIANYFQIDPIWIRLIFLLLFVNVFFGGLSGIIFITYIVLWIILPASDQLEEDVKTKKIYRNPDDKVLGGVAGGLASYFGAEVTVIRLLFVLSIFLGGTGLILYIILWIITPEARTITDKMQMQGEPVTLSNIEQNVKKSLNVKEGEENLLVKVLLFPFRLIALIIAAIGKILGPLLNFMVDAIRVFAGVIILIIGLSFTVALFTLLFIALGLFTGYTEFVTVADLPFDLVRSIVTPLTATFAFLALVIPSIAVTLGGIAIIAKRRLVSSIIAWSMFGIWVISLIGLSFSAPKVIRSWARDGEHREETTYNLANKTAFITLNDLGEKDYTSVKLKIRGHSDSLYLLDKRFTARGESRQDASDNAKAITYNVTVTDSVLSFDSHFAFKEGAIFRAQDLDLTLYVPYGAVFIMDESLKQILLNTLYIDGYRVEQLPGNQWTYDGTGLKCITCADQPESKRSSRSTSTKSDKAQSFDFEDFQHIKATALYDLEIIHGEDYSVEIDASKTQLSKMKAYQRGDEVVFEMNEKNWNWFDDSKKRRVKVYVTMPNIESLSINGACKANIADFDLEALRLEVSGASEAYVQANVRRLNAKVAGASTLKLSGKGTDLDVDVAGASSLKAYNFESDYADINASGASSAEVYVNKGLRGDASGISNIRYRGKGQTDGQASRNSSIRRG